MADQKQKAAKAAAPAESSDQVALKDGKATIKLDGFTIELELLKKPDLTGDLNIQELQVRLTHPKSKQPANTLLTVNTK